MFTKQDWNNIGIFMSRCDIKGSESITHAILMQKIQEEVNRQPVHNSMSKKESEPKEEINVPTETKDVN